MRAFFHGDTDIEQSLRVFQPFMDNLIRFIRKFRTMKVTLFEVAAMAGIILWNEGKDYDGEERSLTLQLKLA
uniref:NR LBD domain-containing protein n=1 Tax=Bursaphelenchus xylophilus TaxID=6326 RepID=A0A1I7SHD3_BURXY